MQKEHYVYAYLDPRKTFTDDEYKFLKSQPFYIGSGKGDRMYQHIHEAKKFKGANKITAKENKLNMWKINKINKLIELGYDPQIIIIASSLTKNEAFQLENELITKYGRICINTGFLTNITGGTVCGQKKFHSGELNPFFGRTHTEETRKIISDTHKNKIISEEQRNLISIANTGKIRSEAQRRNYSESMQRRFKENPNQQMFQNWAALNKKVWKLKTPEDEIIYIENLFQFCQQHGLNQKTLKSTLNSTKKPVARGHAKGWQILDKDLDINSIPNEVQIFKKQYP